MAFSLTTLSWGAIEFLDSYRLTDEIGYVMDIIKWGCDYIMKAHVSPEVFYGQVRRL